MIKRIVTNILKEKRLDTNHIIVINLIKLPEGSLSLLLMLSHLSMLLAQVVLRLMVPTTPAAGQAPMASVHEGKGGWGD